MQSIWLGNARKAVAQCTQAVMTGFNFCNKLKIIIMNVFDDEENVCAPR